MKTYRQREKQGSKVQESTKGPDEAKIKVNALDLQFFWAKLKCQNVLSVTKLFPFFDCLLSKALLERTGYTLDVTTGQRKYGGPPPEEMFKGTHPGIGTEVGVI